MRADEQFSRPDDEARVREHLYGTRREARPTLDPGPIDVVATEAVKATTSSPGSK